MKNKLMIAAGYAAFFVFALLLSLYLTFDPTNIVNAKIQGLAQSNGMQVTIGALDKYRLSGITAEDVEIQPSSLKAPFKIDKLAARLSILPLILGTKSIEFTATLLGGKINGTVAQGKNSFQAKIEAKMVDLGKLQLAKSDALWPAGKFSGQVDLNLPSTKDPKRWRGQIKGSMGEGRFAAFAYQGFQVPEIKIDSMDIDVALLSGKASIKNFSIRSPDLPVDGSGQVELANPISSSPFSIQAKINPSDSYLEKVPALKALIPADKTIKYNGTLGVIIGAGI
jgi:type II secretion system protein N